LDKGTVNYGIARPAFWLDALAWVTLWGAVICTGMQAVHAAPAAADTTNRSTRHKRTMVLMCAPVLFVMSRICSAQNAQAATTSITAQSPTPWHAGWGVDLGLVTSFVPQHAYPFQLAHYMQTKGEYLRRRANSSFLNGDGSQLEHTAEMFDAGNAFLNVHLNLAARDLHRELQQLPPPAPTVDRSGGEPLLVVACYVGAAREGAPMLGHWIEHNLRLGFHHVHFFLDPEDKIVPPQLVARYGERLRLSVVKARPAHTRGGNQGYAKIDMEALYGDTAGWVAWVDVDEFLVPMRWAGPGTLARSLARLRELGFCDIQVLTKSQ
jgi:hypothetical protein